MKNFIISRNFLYPKKAMGNLSSTNEYEQMRSCLFKKYFPKYLKEFSLLPQNHIGPLLDPKIFSKTIKRTKILYNPSPSFVFHPKWKPLFGNKRKCIRHLDYNYPQSLQKLVKRAKYFPRLESLSLEMPIWSQQNETNNKICKRVVFKLTKRLKRLELKELTPFHAIFLQKLDSSPEFLRSLDKLRLACSSHLLENQILQLLRKYKTLLEYTNSFVTNPLGGYSYCKSFQMLGRTMPNLENLQVDFSYCCYKFVDYLGAIGTFKNLKVVKLNVGNINIFLRDFVLPRSVKDLKLHFGDDISNFETEKSSLTRLKNNKDKITPQLFEENKTLARFYENFGSLKSLENLEMKFLNSTNLIDYQCLIYFSENILKRISSPLKSLILLPPYGSYDREGNYSSFQYSLKESHLPNILSSLKSTSETLENLEIGHERIIFMNLDFSDCHGMFKNLENVTITGKLEDNGMNDQISLLLNQVISLGDKIKLVRLRTVTENKVESLLYVLRQINKLEEPEKLKIELEIRFLKGKDLENVNFENVIEEVKKEEVKMKDVSLTLFTKITSELMGEFLGIYGGKFESFKNLPKFLGS